MPTILDLLYVEYCHARLAEMRKQLLIAGSNPEVRQAGYYPADQGAAGATDARHEFGRGAPNGSGQQTKASP